MDERTLATIAVVLFLLVVFGLPIFYLIRHKAKIKRVWTELAENNDLELQMGRWPSVHGEQNGRHFEMGSAVGRTASGSAALDRVNQFYVIADVAGVPADLAAGRRGRLQGAGPVQTENADFNKRIWVDCPDKQAAGAYLTPPRQAALMRLATYDGVLRAGEGGEPARISLLRDGYKVRLDWLEERRAAFVEIAEALDA
jgi:hypothetical protein